MFGKARLVLALLAVVAAVGAPASAGIPKNLAKQHHAKRAIAQVIGKGTCTFEMSWSKLPSAEKTKALQLDATASCPASINYNAWFDLSEDLVLLKHPVVQKYAFQVIGQVSFSVRFKEPATLRKYSLDFRVQGGNNDDEQVANPNKVCTNLDFGAGGLAWSCTLTDVIWVKRGNDALGRILGPVPF